MNKKKRFAVLVLALCVLCSGFLTVPSLAAETEIFGFGTAIAHLSGSPNEGYIQMQSAGTGTPRINLNTWTTSGNGNEGRSAFSIAADRESFTLKQSYHQAYGDNVQLRSLADSGNPLDMNGPIMVTIRFKTALDDYTKDVKARIRMRLNLQLAGGAQDFDLDSALMPVTPDSGYQTMQFYFDPAKGDYRSFINGAADQAKAVQGAGTVLNTASFYLLGYPNESPQKIEALTTPLTWTIDSITVARDAALPSGGGTAQTPKLTVDSNLAIEGDQLKDQDTGHSVYFRGWTGGTLALGTEPGQTVWKTVKESINEDHIAIPGNGTGGWTDGGFWTLRDDARLVFEVKVRVKPETEGQGVRARLHFYALDSGGTEIGNWGAKTLDFAMDGAFHEIRYIVDQAQRKYELQIDGITQKADALAGDVSNGIQKVRIYTACDNGGTPSGKDGTERAPLNTPVSFTFDSFKVYEEGGKIDEDVIEPNRPDPVEKPIPESLRDTVVRTYPNGLMKAAVMSYDDATNWNFDADKTMLDILNRHQVRCTLNAITDQLPDETMRKYMALGAGTTHELASHSKEHAKIDAINLKPDKNAYMTSEAEGSRAYLEGYTGTGTVRGWVTPYGYDLKANGFYGIIRNAGYDYIRGIGNTSGQNRFSVPANFLSWDSTMAFEGTDDQYALLKQYMDEFLALSPDRNFKLFFIWGHSHGFGKHVGDVTDTPTQASKDTAWGRMEEWAQYLEDNKETVWNPTCLEYADYVDAVRGLDIRDAGGAVKVSNPSDRIDCFLRIDGQVYEIKAGADITVRIRQQNAFDYIPSSYLMYLGDNIQSAGGKFTEIGSISGWTKTNKMQVGSDSITFTQNTHSYFSDTLTLSAPEGAFDMANPTVISVRYRVSAADYGADLPLARLVLTNGGIMNPDGIAFAANSDKTPNTGDVTLSEALGNTWRTVDFIIDPAGKQVYVSNDGGPRTAYAFTSELTPEIMKNFRLYPAVRPSDTKVWQAETDPPAALTTTVAWTIDCIQMYQIAPEESLRISAVGTQRDETRISYVCSFKNFGTEMQAGVGIAALYDKGARVMKDYRQVDLSALAPGGTQQAEGSFTDPESGRDYEVRVYIWNTLGQMRPYDARRVDVTE